MHSEPQSRYFNRLIITHCQARAYEATYMYMYMCYIMYLDQSAKHVHVPYIYILHIE